MRMRMGVASRVIAAAAGAFASSGAAASAQDGYAAFGSSVYETDEFCLNSSAFITDYTLGASGDIFGASASYDNSDWPWPPPFPPGGGSSVVPAVFLRLPSARQEQVYLSQGEAFRGVLDVFALELIRRLSGGAAQGGIARLDRFVRPLFGVGVQVSTDGDAVLAGGGRNADTYGVKGDINFLIQYGARVYLPSRDRPIRLQLEYRGTSMFVDSFELETPSGEILRVDGATRNWGGWSAGVSVRLGG